MTVFPGQNRIIYFNRSSRRLTLNRHVMTHIYSSFVRSSRVSVYRASFLLSPGVTRSRGRALGSRDRYGSIAREGALITGPRAREKTQENRSLQLLGQQQSADREKKDAHSACCIKRTLRERDGQNHPADIMHLQNLECIRHAVFYIFSYTIIA